MRITNDKISGDSIFITHNGTNQTISQIINQLQNSNFQCCNNINNRLDRIEKRINNISIVREILIQQPSKSTNTIKPPRLSTTSILPNQPVLDDRFIIDQSMKDGYTDVYYTYDKLGNKLNNPFVYWLKQDDGFRRRLLPKEIPFKRGSVLANQHIEKIKEVYNQNNISLDETTLRYKNLSVGFNLPKTTNKWSISGRNVIDENGNDLKRFLPINFNKVVDSIILNRITGYRVDEKIKASIGYEPIIFTYEVIDKDRTIRTFEAGVNNWLKYV